MPHATPTVLVVDDDVSVRKSLELLIDSVGWQTETFGSATEFLSRAPVPGPSCLVLDVGLPDISGLDLQQRLAAERTTMPIIFISGRGDVPMTVRAMKAGAVEFLTKPLASDALLCAIQAAIEKSRTALDREEAMRPLKEHYASLSRRERQVMTLVISGLLNKQVGGELGISEITVKAHRGNVMRKMNADSLPDLVTMAARLELVTVPKACNSTARLRASGLSNFERSYSSAATTRGALACSPGYVPTASRTNSQIRRTHDGQHTE